MIFDRSWYNRAGVEHVMGLCTKAQHHRFLELCPQVESYIVSGGVQLVNIWLEVSDAEQKRRFEARIEDPLRQLEAERDGSPVVQSVGPSTPCARHGA